MQKYKLQKEAFKNAAHGQHLALLHVCDLGLPILYHESKSIPWLLPIPWVHVYTMSPCQYHESKSIPWMFPIPRVHVNNMSQYSELKSIEENWWKTVVFFCLKSGFKKIVLSQELISVLNRVSQKYRLHKVFLYHRLVRTRWPPRKDNGLVCASWPISLDL